MHLDPVKATVRGELLPRQVAVRNQMPIAALAPDVMACHVRQAETLERTVGDAVVDPVREPRANLG